LCGITYECETCLDFAFCYKCYLSRHLIHPDHPFKIIGLEYEPVVYEVLGEKNDESDGDGDDSDTDGDDTEGDDDDDG
jgi:hypothetical protein